jgi:hypothetical protein
LSTILHICHQQLIENLQEGKYNAQVNLVDLTEKPKMLINCKKAFTQLCHVIYQNLQLDSSQQNSNPMVPLIQ